MSKINDGGPAFPSLYPRSDEDGRQGMSLRAYCAVHLDVPWQWVEKVWNATEPTLEEVSRIMARMRVIQADELIAELEKLGK